MNKTNPKVDVFLSEAKNWQKELSLLRTICLDCGLVEDYKWMHPCYTINNKNVVLIHGFKDYCAINFFKGALLKDSKNILVQPTKNIQAERQIRFTNLQEIEKQEPTIKQYIREAIEIEKAGLKVQMKKTSDFDVPKELKDKFDSNLKLKIAFETLTPGRQRAYLLYFSSAKQATTREARIEKYTKRIFDGKGINDCVCGHSKRMPSCDGSHKLFK